METFCLNESLITCLRKSTFEIGLEWYFSLSWTFLWKHSFKSIIYDQLDCLCLWTVYFYYVVKIAPM